MKSPRSTAASACNPDECCGADARDLATLIRCYRRNHPALDQMLNDFRLLSWPDAIRQGAGAIGPDGKMYSHQYRPGRLCCKRAADKLLEVKNRIFACKSFKKLKQLIKEYTANVERFGELCVYDATLRIGAKRNLLPIVVDLHAGTRKGAKNWGCSTRKGYLEVNELEREFRSLQPYEIENFFCIYKDELKLLREKLGPRLVPHSRH